MIFCISGLIPGFERNVTIDDVHGADEAFVTGTFAGLTPAKSIDGIAFVRGPLTERLQHLYRRRVADEVGDD